jgi:hypothetical protein
MRKIMTSKLVFGKENINFWETELGQLNLKLYHGKKNNKKNLTISSLIIVEKRPFYIW